MEKWEAEYRRIKNARGEMPRIIDKNVSIIQDCLNTMQAKLVRKEKPDERS